MLECSGDNKSSDVAMECSGTGSDVAKVTSYVVLYIIWWSLILPRIGGDSKSSDVAMECSAK